MIPRWPLAISLALACDAPSTTTTTRNQDAGMLIEDAGLIDASGVADAGCDTNTDSNNCGVCGHSCLGRACNAGLCAPEELFRLTYLSSCIMLHANRVYLTHGSTIERYDLDGRNRVALLPFYETCEQLAVHDEKLYFAKSGGDGETVFRMNLDGSERETIFQGENVADAPRKILFTDQGLLLSTRKRIWSIDLQTLARRVVYEEPRDTSSYQPGITFGTLYNKGFVTFTRNGFGVPSAEQKIIHGVPLAGGTREVLSSVTALPVRFAALAGDTAYYAGGTKLFSFALSAPNLVASTVASNLVPGQNVGIEAREHYVYVTASGNSGFADGSVYRVDAATGEVITLARGDMNYANIALDDAYVYFVQNSPRPRVVRVPR
jgi:hypothetical protein